MDRRTILNILKTTFRPRLLIDVGLQSRNGCVHPNVPFTRFRKSRCRIQKCICPTFSLHFSPSAVRRTPDIQLNPTMSHCAMYRPSRRELLLVLTSTFCPSSPPPSSPLFYPHQGIVCVLRAQPVRSKEVTFIKARKADGDIICRCRMSQQW